MLNVVQYRLVEQVALADHVHQTADKQSEQGQYPMDGKIHLDHQVVQAGHDQDRQIFIEILDSD